MTGTNLPLRQTKLQRPRVLRSVVARPKLWALLDDGFEKPLTLVCAGPGFGKTTLVSSWLEERAARDGTLAPAAWLSLDRNDSDLTLFLHYLVAAVRTVAGDVCTETLALLQSRQQLRNALLATTLVNELARLPARIILVLDDYSAVGSEAVDEFLLDFVEYLPSTLHLVLITRRNPLLPLPLLRARDEVTEIRSQRLRFSHEETRAYLDAVLPRPIDEAAVATLEQHSEGWIAGLKLSTLTLRSATNMEAMLATLAVNAANIADYLDAEALARQPAPIQVFLLKTSILDHFCPSLCHAILGDEDPVWDAATCIRWLERADLFIVPLDNQAEWYRFHHLFSEMLHERLVRTLSAAAVSELHRRAAIWFAEQELNDDALHHALRADDIDLFVGLIERATPAALNREDRATLERWLALVPGKLIQQHPELLMLKAWALQFTWQLRSQVRLLDQAEALINVPAGDSTRAGRQRNMRAQLAVLRGQQTYTLNRPEEAAGTLTEALLHVPETWTYVRGGAILYLGASLQAVGKFAAAEKMLIECFDRCEDKRDGYALRICLSLCFIYVAQGRLEQARQTANDMLRLAKGTALPTIHIWANYFLGFVHYQWNQLEIAERHLTETLVHRFTAIPIAAREGLNLLALVRQQQHRDAEAVHVADLLSELDLEQLGREDDTTRGLRAQLLLLQGDREGAARWADAYDAPIPEAPLIWFASPHWARLRILLARGRDADLMAVSDMLDRLDSMAERTHNRRARIELLSMRAVALDRQGNGAAAEVALRQAVELAAPGGFVRAFVDLGATMQRMLARLAAQGVAVGHLLAAFPEAAAPEVDAARGNGRTQPAPAHATPSLIEPLTPRELEVLRLLREPLSNREIARRLDISYATVKRHTITIYGKLGVNNRWDAVSKAENLDQHTPR
jgi:LuxR family transcriptional regulator, maltose regulon positive regulatory protein